MKKLKTTIKISMLLLSVNLFIGCALWPKDPGRGNPNNIFKALAGTGCPSNQTGSNSSTGGVDSSLPFIKNFAKNDGAQSEFFLTPRVGIMLELPVNNKFSLSTAVVISGKGNKTTNAGFEDKLTSTYLDVPLIVNYKLGESKFSVNGGLQPSILLAAKRKITGNGNENSQTVTNQFNTFDLAATIGVGYHFDNGLGLNFGYDYGLTNINKSAGGFKAYNRTMHLGVSYTFKKK